MISKVNLKKILLQVLLTLMIFVLAGCNSISRVQHQDSFYNYSGNYQYLRFPLIKPYYMSYLDDGYAWELDLEGFESPPPNDNWTYSEINNIDKLSVADRVIMVYSPYVSDRADENIKENFLHWFVIVPDNHIETGFKSEDEFLKYIHNLGIQQPNWLNPSDLFTKFEQTNCLEWIPDCQK